MSITHYVLRFTFYRQENISVLEVSMKERLQGIFPVLQTPLDGAGDLDVGSLEREVDFCIAAGAHGLVYPALGSELQYLSDRERQQLVEIVLRAAADRAPVVVAVSAPSAA